MNIDDSNLQKLFLLLIFIFSYFNPAVTRGVTEDALEEQESEEIENSLVTNVRNDCRNGFVELLNFVDSLNNALIALNTKLAAQDTAFATLNKKIDAQKVELINSLNEKIDAQKVEILSTLNARLSTQDVHLTALIPKVALLSQKSNLLLKTAYSNLNTWEGVDRLIRNQAKEITTGKSFNGSTLSDIKSRAAQVGYSGSHTAVVFVNHLDEAIGNFTIYEEYKKMYNPAPSTVPGSTQEIFTFAIPSSGYWGAWTSFSYLIPSLDCRVAAISNGGAWGVGLAFITKESDMETYYDSHEGIEGSSVWESGEHVSRNLSVGYKNFYARMFADYRRDHKATLRIELTKLPLDA